LKLFQNLILLLILVLGTFQISHAQIRGNKNSPTPKGTQSRKSKKPVQSTIKKDSTLHNYFYIEDIEKKYTFKDSLVNDLDIYNPAHKSREEHFTIGNLGSAAFPIRHQTFDKIGIRHGIEQYDLYNFTLDSIRLHELIRPYNDLYFSPLSSQENFMVKAKFARNFSDGISLHLNYNRIKQQGFYTDQETLTTNFSSSILYQNSNGRQISLLTLLVNNNNEENNGGVTGGDIGTLAFDQPVEEFYRFGFYRIRSRIPTVLSDADSRKEQLVYSWLNRYHLVKGNENGSDIYVQHQIDYEKGAFRSSDVTTQTSLDSSLYRDFLIDNRGLRYAIKNKSLTNDAKIGFRKSDLLRFATGLKHTWHRYDLGGEDINLNELVAYGDLSTQKGIFSLNGNAQLGLADVAGDLNLKGSIGFSSQYFFINGGIHFYRYRPDLQFQKLYLNQELFWENTFEKPFGTELSGSIDIPLLRLKGRLSQLVETNTLYWDSIALPQQLDEVLSITRLELEQKLKLGIIHLDSRIMYQLVSENQIALPEFLWNERLYLQGKIFKQNLEIQTGFELNYLPDFQSRNYFPLTGNFGNTDESLKAYPLTNAFINAKVSSFRVFFKFENINDFLIEQPLYHVAHYPQYDWNFRFGIRWILAN